MVGLCFHFDDPIRDVFSGRSVDLDAWRYAGKAFGINNFAMIDNTTGGVAWNIRDEDCTLTIYKSYQEFLDATEGPYVFSECRWDLPEEAKVSDVADFAHPAGGWYCFGGSGQQVITKGQDSGHQWVSIPMVKKYSMHAVQAAGVILHDRFVKSGKPGAL